jgi:hypothetical protein
MQRLGRCNYKCFDRTTQFNSPISLLDRAGTIQYNISLDRQERFKISKATQRFSRCNSISLLDRQERFKISKATQRFSRCNSISLLDRQERFKISKATQRFSRCNSISLLDRQERFNTISKATQSNTTLTE